MTPRTLAAVLFCALTSWGCGGIGDVGSTGGGGGGGASAPTLQLDASPANVTTGASASLSWNATDATNCTASGGWSGTKPVSGAEVTGALLSSKLYTLTCAGSGGTAEKTVAVTVGSPTPTVTLTADPASVVSGGSTTLTWGSTDATSCTASGGWSGTKSTSGSEPVSALTATTSFTLTCTGTGGTATQAVTVTVSATPPAPTVTFTASPTTVILGNSTTLSWSASNATSCSASGGWSGDKPVDGTEPSAPLSATTSFTLSCAGSGGTTSQTVTVTTGTPPPPPTVAFTASPTTIASGGSSTLTWSSTNATSCTASGGWSGSKATSGSQSTSPLAATTSFTLTCAGAGGSAVQTATVTVAAAPTLTFTASPTVVASGGTSTLTWSTTNATSCTASVGWAGTKATSGTQVTGALTSSTSYTLTCSGAGGSTTQTVSVAVGSAPTVSLNALPATIASSGSSTLTWSSTNATSCTASGGWTGSKATSGSQSTGALAASTTFTLTCDGAGGSAGQSVTVAVVPAPTVALSASPTTTTSGASSALTWSSTNATSCSASNGWLGVKATAGSETTAPLASTTTFTLTCTGTGGSATQDVTVTVVPAATVTLSVAPSTIPSGSASTLTWGSTNATSCTASNGWSGAKATSGTQPTGPITSTTTFTLTCTGPGGSSSQSAVLTVVPAPTVSLSASPASVSSGGSSSLTWNSTNATSCTASGGWTGAKATSGTQSTGALSATATFTLTCTGSGGSASQSTTVTVVAPAPTVALTASPVSVTSGGSSTLTWNSTDATSCTASGGWTGAKSTSGTQSTGALSATTTFTLTCTGPGGTANNSVTVTVGAAAGPVFPLHVEAGKRYLIDAAGQPFFIHGDTPWDLIAQLRREDVDIYLEARRLKGFNTILVELMEHQFSSNPPNNAYGDPPFTTPGDFATPNEAYFAHAEYVIAKAQAKGMLVLITPAYMGFGGGSEGWYTEMVANGEAKLRTYGQYVANRFKAYNNILWVEGGDYNPPEKALLRAVANGIRDVTPSVLQTFHGERGTSALAFLGASEPWLTVNNIYTNESTVVANAFLEYGRSTMPFFLIEGRYEGETTGTELVARLQAYQTVLSGGSGHLYGNNPVWLFGSGWQTALNAPGAASLVHLRTLFESVAWWNLVPDTVNTFLTAGVGSGSSRAVAAKASTSAFAIVYTPAVRTLTVNVGQMSGPNVRARWYDPTQGTYTTAAGSPFAASGSRSFTPVGANANGFGDWVLILESTP